MPVTFWDVVWLTLFYWFLGSMWIAMYFGHKIKMAEFEQKAIDKEYEIENLKSDFRKS